MGKGFFFVFVRPSKNSKKNIWWRWVPPKRGDVHGPAATGLAFWRELGSRNHSCWDKPQSCTNCLLSHHKTGLVIFGVSVNLPEIVKLRVSQNIFDAQHRGHHGVILIVILVHAVASDEMEVGITVVELLADHGDVPRV